MKSKSSSDADIKKIHAKIGSAVSFTYSGEGTLKGTLKDREVVAAGEGYYQ